MVPVKAWILPRRHGGNLRKQVLGEGVIAITAMFCTTEAQRTQRKAEIERKASHPAVIPESTLA